MGGTGRIEREAGSFVRSRIAVVALVTCTLAIPLEARAQLVMSTREAPRHDDDGDGDDGDNDGDDSGSSYDEAMLGSGIALFLTGYAGAAMLGGHALDRLGTRVGPTEIDATCHDIVGALSFVPLLGPIAVAIAANVCEMDLHWIADDEPDRHPVNGDELRTTMNGDTAYTIGAIVSGVAQVAGFSLALCGADRLFDARANGVQATLRFYGTGVGLRVDY
ncbi:MAG: hypothetical protein AB7P00_19795 [Sandaracinaceae bacterium]